MSGTVALGKLLFGARRPGTQAAGDGGGPTSLDFIWYGQSNQLGHFSEGSSPPAAADAPLVYTTDNLAAAGSEVFPAFNFIDDIAATGSGISWTASGFSFGAPSTEERLVVCIVSVAGSAALSSSVLDPDTGSNVNGANTVVAGGGSRSLNIAQYVVPAGVTSFDIALTSASGWFANPMVHAYWEETAAFESLTATDTDSASVDANTTATVNLTTEAGGAILVGAISINISANTGTLSGDETFATRVDATLSGGRHVSGDASNIADGTNDNTVTVTYTQSANLKIIAAAWR